jgi:deoxyribodipyrimidine photo-lyase
MIKQRMKNLNKKKWNGNNGYFVYWMQSSQRVEYNLALNYIIEKANEYNRDILVVFVLTDYSEANIRHYDFMVQGLEKISRKLEDKNIRFVVLNGNPVDQIKKISKRSSLLVTDRGYLKHLIAWREEISKKVDVPFVQVEDNVLLPVEMVSNKEEYTAATLRRKYNRILEEFEENIEIHDYKGNYVQEDFDEVDLSNYKEYLELDKSLKPTNFKGGHDEGIKIFKDFLNNKIEKYSEMRNDPVFDNQSNISPYLHFGMISPIEINDLLKNYSGEGKHEYFEEAFVRRELARNFCYYNKNYDNFDCITGWARETLKDHEKDEREYNYSFEDFEKAKTHDEYWNAAQMEMAKTGKMHGYMRMYWAKKVLEWTETPEIAYDYLIKLNNKYELDGRDESGYTGVAWTFGKHDRAWTERKIIGKIRYMNANGLKRKFDIDKYVQKIKDLD